MKISPILFSILTLFLLVMLSSCDNDNNSNAQDMGEEPMADICPCFDLEYLQDLGMQSTNIQCSIEGIGLLLTYNAPDMPEIATACLLDGGCSCQSPLIFMGGAMGISEQEYSLCLQDMLNAMIAYNNTEDKLEPCVIFSN